MLQFIHSYQLNKPRHVDSAIDTTRAAPPNGHHTSRAGAISSYAWMPGRPMGPPSLLLRIHPTQLHCPPSTSIRTRRGPLRWLATAAVFVPPISHHTTLRNQAKFLQPPIMHRPPTTSGRPALTWPRLQLRPNQILQLQTTKVMGFAPVLPHPTPVSLVRPSRLLHVRTFPTRLLD
jgi:hypothetical protein